MKINPPEKNDRYTIRLWLLKHKSISTESLAIRSGLTIRKIMEWKLVCDVVDPQDQRLFTAWVYYKDYTIPEAAILLGITSRSFRYFLKKYNITKYNRSNKQFSDYRCQASKCEFIGKEPLKDPRTFEQLYSKYGGRVLARMAGVSPTQILYCARKYGIQSPRTQWRGPPHPYKNKEWLMEMYVARGLSTIQCASMAGVCDRTIRNWLVYFGIKPRTISEANNLRHHYSRDLSRAITYVREDDADSSV